MRAIGVAERAIELMCARADERVTFGKSLAEQGVIRDWIAESMKLKRPMASATLEEAAPLNRASV